MLFKLLAVLFGAVAKLLFADGAVKF